MLLQQFQQRLKAHFLLQPAQVQFVIAVSGGIDSIVLAHLVYKAGYDFIIAHCNFQLRGIESERDENFVRTLEENYGKQVLVAKFDTAVYAEKNKISIQEAARDLRYSWFYTLCNNGLPAGANHNKPRILLTAHNANDNIETAMMHFFRGTGIHGLTGIPEKDTTGKIVRPLLFAKREQIAAYAQDNNLYWVEDTSNSSEKYTRNFFRLRLIPEVTEIFPRAEDNILHNIGRLKETNILYRQAIDLHIKKLLTQKANEWYIPILKLKKTVPLATVIWEIIKPFNFSAAQTGEVMKMLRAASGSYIQSPTHRIINNRAWLIIAPLQSTAANTILIEATDKKIVFENGLLLIEKMNPGNYTNSTAETVAMLDAADIQFPLLLRKWKTGDYFYPLGMQKKKKLSRFFIDSKLSKTAKENVWVIESAKKIIWIAGLRIDDRFKITPHTKNIIQLSWKK